MPIEPYPAVDPAVHRAALLPARETYRRLRIAGLSAREAGTLTGRLAGLGPASTGWTIGEVERLLFVRAMVDTGRIGS